MDLSPKKSTPSPAPASLAPGAVAGINAGMIIGIVIAVIVLFVFHYGAARLSYNTYGSYPWSFVAFIFAMFYYPYYAFFVSRPTTLFGGKRR